MSETCDDLRRNNRLAGTGFPEYTHHMGFAETHGLSSEVFEGEWCGCIRSEDFAKVEDRSLVLHNLAHEFLCHFIYGSTREGRGVQGAPGKERVVAMRLEHAHER